jgi:hypothetical protein
MIESRPGEPMDAAYRQLKETIDGGYPKGWFVGIADGQVLADAADFQKLEALLRAQNHDPRDVMVVEAGVAYPEFVTIFV